MTQSVIILYLLVLKCGNFSQYTSNTYVAMYTAEWAAMTQCVEQK